jgi:predicted O-methyltransferase YrrM
MFHQISEKVLQRMAYLEMVDVRDRTDGTPHLQRMRQIPPETGKILALLAASAPPGVLLEVGTSAGYSSLWVSQACRLRGDRLMTFEILPEKIRLARETISVTESEDVIILVEGDARQFLTGIQDVAFCFLDAEKDIYLSCYDLVIPNLVKGGWLVADNVISHADELHVFIDLAMTDERIDSLVLNIGNGLLLCRKV